MAIASGILWSLAYLLIIRRGYQDKASGMPLAALCLNLSWEFIFSFVYPHTGVQRVVDIAWFALDLIILFEFLRYEPARRKPGTPKAYFYAAFLAVLVTAFLLIVLATREFDNYGGYYTAFGQNLLMSMLFIGMLMDRPDLAGQSVYIGAAKMLGTFAASLTVFRYLPQSGLTVFFGWSCLFFDLAYVALYVWKARRLGIPVLRRW